MVHDALGAGEAADAVNASIERRMEPWQRDCWRALRCKWQHWYMSWHQSGQPAGEALRTQAEAARRLLQTVGKAERRKRARSADSPGLRQEWVQRRPKRSPNGTRVAALGRMPVAQPDTPSASTAAHGSRVWITEHVLPTSVAKLRPAADIIPPRRAAYAPVNRQSQDQLQAMKSLRLDRLLTREAPDAFFAVGTMEKAVRAWRDGGGTGMVPVSVIASAVTRSTLPCSCTADTGHVWSVREMAPLDSRQLLAALGSRFAERAVATASARAELTESMVRQALGGTTHGGLTAVAAARAMERMRAKRQHVRQEGATVGALGAGIGLSAAQLARAVGGKVAFTAEGCESVGPAGDAMLRALGHSPRRFGRAEAEELATSAWRTDAEVVTMPCGAYSPAGSGKELHARLRELAAVMSGVAARRPPFVLVETSAGLWRTPDVRARYEAILLACGAYEWEALRIDPAEHLGLGVSRERVVYVGVREGRSWRR